MIKKLLATTAFLLIVNCVFSQKNIEEDQIIQAQKCVTEGNYNLALSILNEFYLESDISYNLIKGITYENVGRFDSATIAYRRVIAIDSTYAPAYKGLARCNTSTNNVLGAISNYKMAIELDSSCVASRIKYAALLRKSKIMSNMATAMQQYKWLTLYDSTNYYFWELAGDCAYEAAIALLTLNYYNQAYQLCNNNPQLSYKYARFLNQLKVPLNEIKPIIDSGLTRDSLYFPLYELLGKIYLDNNKNKSAEEILSKAYNLGDTATFVINKYLAISLFKNQKQLQSESHFAKAYELDSTDIFLNYAYACALYDTGEQYKAIELLDNTKQIIFPDSAMVSKIYELEGDINTRYQRTKQAYNSYYTAIVFMPENHEVLSKITGTCMELKDFELAKYYINQYVSAINNNTELTEKEKNRGTRWAKYKLEQIEEEIFFKDDPEALRLKRTQRMLDSQKKAEDYPRAIIK